ncbi:unnamed protein product [Ambrosiozyma monospora]|uniref:Unnamed protein product n=1 Tax=Ambrosiozyma monospora TaxID=43982 RepID=A0ACB5T3Y2_AMBMO|nr:unnamed protein product [Ambrosiozyma monospora]
MSQEENLEQLLQQIEAHSQNTKRQIDTLKSDLQVYVTEYDPERLSSELRHESEANGKGLDELKENAYKDEDYMYQLEICNKLWFIKGLLNELGSLELVETHDWKLLNFEGAISAYTKLIQRVADFNNNIHAKDHTIKILDEINLKLDFYEEKLITLIKLYVGEYLKFDDQLSFMFSNKIEDLSFQQFLDLCNTLTTARSEDPALIRLFNFNKMFREWVSEILVKLQDGHSLETSKTANTIGIYLEKSPSEFINYVKSVKKLVNFFNSFLELVENKKKSNPFSTSKSTVGKEILKTLKAKIFSSENIYPLMLDNLNKRGFSEGKSIIAELLEISSLLSQSGWSPDGICELEFWIEDLPNYWVTELVDSSIDEIKNICIELKAKGPAFKDIFEVLMINELPDLNASTDELENVGFRIVKKMTMNGITIGMMMSGSKRRLKRLTRKRRFRFKLWITTMMEDGVTGVTMMVMMDGQTMMAKV